MESSLKNTLGSCFGVHFYLMLSSVLVCLSVIFLLRHIYPHSVQRAFLSLVLASPFILLLWLTRRGCYVRLKASWATLGGALYLALLLTIIYGLRVETWLLPTTALLGIGVLSSGFVLFLLVALRPRRLAVGGTLYLVLLVALIYVLSVRKQPTAEATFLGMGAAALVVSALLLTRLRPRWGGLRENPTAAMVATDHWRYGRWSIATGAASWLPDGLFYVLLPAWIGFQGTGALRALMNLAMPALQVFTALSMLLLPLLVRTRLSGGITAMNKTIKVFLALFVSGSAMYPALLGGTRFQLFRLLYVGRYEEYSSLLLLVGLLPLGAGISAVLGSALRAAEQTESLFWCYVASGIAAITAGLPLAARFGLLGALIGLLLSLFLKDLLMFLYYKKAVRSHT